MSSGQKPGLLRYAKADELSTHLYIPCFVWRFSPRDVCCGVSTNVSAYVYIRQYIYVELRA